MERGWQIEREGLNHYLTICGLRARNRKGELLGAIKSVTAVKIKDELCFRFYDQDDQPQSGPKKLIKLRRDTFYGTNAFSSLMAPAFRNNSVVAASAVTLAMTTPCLLSQNDASPKNSTPAPKHSTKKRANGMSQLSNQRMDGQQRRISLSNKTGLILNAMRNRSDGNHAASTPLANRAAFFNSVSTGNRRRLDFSFFNSVSNSNRRRLDFSANKSIAYINSSIEKDAASAYDFDENEENEENVSNDGFIPVYHM